MVTRARPGLTRATTGLGRLWQPAERRLRRALDDVVYGGSYFGEGRDPNDRAYLSGYARYDRNTSNANAAAYLVWRWFPATTSFDVVTALETLEHLSPPDCGEADQR